MIKVLIVDDEYLAREGMKKTIPWKDYGCLVCGEAQDGIEGIEIARKLNPDIIITDISMPEMNGIEMAKEIRSFLPDCKLIIITGYDEFKYAKAAIKLNAVDFILKPVDEAEFLSAVRKAAEASKKLSSNISISKKDVIRISNILKEEKELLLSIRACSKTKLEEQLRNIYFNMLSKEKESDDIIKQVSIDIVLKALNILGEYNISVEDADLENLDIYKKAAAVSTIEEAYNWVYKVLLSILNSLKAAAVEASESGIIKATEYIKKHFCEDISLKDVAKEVYMSESYLSRKIKKVTGINFVEYITKLRMEKAVDLLKESNVKITEVASTLGYSDYRYFSQTFKKHTGYSPSEFVKSKN